MTEVERLLTEMEKLLRRALVEGDPVEIANEGADGSLTVILHDGQRMLIAPGKAKRVIVRSEGKFHLLDCQCTLCVPARKDGAA